jgi:hypothetical protein
MTLGKQSGKKPGQRTAGGWLGDILLKNKNFSFSLKIPFTKSIQVVRLV